MKPGHTSHTYDAELRELRGHLVAMGARCERALARAVAIFLDRDASASAEVDELDERIDRDEMEIDELALRILALRQPVAYDLRFLGTTLKFVTDLERIGDKAVSIARRARELAGTRIAIPDTSIAQFGTLVQAMLRQALDAFVEGSVERAEVVLAQEEEANALFREIQSAVVAWIREHANDVTTGLAVLSVARGLERVADHATNLAEQVVFLVRGDDVRHRPRAPRTAEATARKA
jgi:phosphate transport system protein